MNAAPLADTVARADDAQLRDRRRLEVVAALTGLVPPQALLYQREDVAPYECDGLTAYREHPLVVVLPETEAQVAAVLRTCHRLDVPVVARGAGTGLSGGALPHRLGVTLSLAKFNKILKLDQLSRTAVVQSGVQREAPVEFGYHGRLARYAATAPPRLVPVVGPTVAAWPGRERAPRPGMAASLVRRRGHDPPTRHRRRFKARSISLAASRLARSWRLS